MNDLAVELRGIELIKQAGDERYLPVFFAKRFTFYIEGTFNNLFQVLKTNTNSISKIVNP
jgi:hypothetical protein